MLLSCQRLPGLVLTQDCSSQAALGLLHAAAGYISTDTPEFFPQATDGFLVLVFFLDFKSYRLKKNPANI